MHSEKFVYKVNRRDINYIRWTVESYDGMGIVRTIDSYQAFIEVLVPHGCEKWINSLLDSLKHEEGLEIIRMAPSSVQEQNF